jgi:hypothetical protein
VTTAEKSTYQTVIPVMHPSMQGLIHESVGRGWISYEEINSALPDEFLSPGKIDELLVLLSALNIEFCTPSNESTIQTRHAVEERITNSAGRRSR